MRAARRATIYFEPSVHRALRLRAAATDRSLSDMVNASVKRALAEDADDLAVLKKRRGEPDISLAEAVKLLRRRGKI